MNKSRYIRYRFFFILLLAAFLRLYGINWDQNQHLHPDERFLTMVSEAIKWPENISQYFNTNLSPLNPHNSGFPFFVYGTFPIFFTKLIAEGLNLGDYNNITLVGRQLSALIDIGTVILVFLITKEIINHAKLKQSYNYHVPLFAMFFYAVSVLPIQLSHFYAVDTYLTFFLTLSFYILIKFINCKLIGNWKLKIGNYAIPLGIAFGLALSSKISAILFIPIIGLVFLISFIKNRKISLFSHCFIIALFIGTFYFTLRLTQPYLFATSDFLDITPNPKVLDNWEQLKHWENPASGFPPSIQWIGLTPATYVIKNIILWGLGLPLGILTLIGFLLSLHTLIKLKGKTIWTLIVLWTIGLMCYQLNQYPQNMRYYFPLYPFYAIFAAYVLNFFNIKKFTLITLGIIVLIWPISFIAIYKRPHSRIIASQWIYENIPQNATLSSETWDDTLPLFLPQNENTYNIIPLDMYDQDNPEKWEKLNSQLEKIDYLILSSNRLWNSIQKGRKTYPITSNFYKDLLEDKLNFKKVAEISSYPSLPFVEFNPFKTYSSQPSLIDELSRNSIRQLLSGLSQGVIVDDTSDESYTVYDHPKIIIFKNIRTITPSN